MTAERPGNDAAETPETDTMSDMRLIVAGAGGRMGRTLIKAIAETKGVTVSGALEQARLAADRAERA